MNQQTATRTKQRELRNGAPSTWKISDDVLALRVPHASVLPIVNAALSRQEQHITNLPTTQLLRALAAGVLTAHDVLEAYAHRAMAAHQVTTCLSESNLEAARIRARELDTYRRDHTALVGPLHGLPVSLMDRFHVAGVDSACGFASWAGKKKSSEDEGTLVRTLRHLGAIVHYKTNVPMTMMLGETANNIIGTTTNPFSANLSAGGACGGEGALLALRGSCLGFGTDIAGSGRIPAAFCGLWSLKCSQGRLADDGIATVLAGIPLAAGAIALMVNELATLTPIFKLLVDSRLANSDPNALELPWRQEKWDNIDLRRGSPVSGSGQLVFGVMRCDGVVRPHPSIQGAINIVTEGLEKQGHEIIAWEPPSHGAAVGTLLEILGSTSALSARNAIDASGERPIPHIAEWYDNLETEPNSTMEFWALCDKLNRFRASYKAYWHSMGAKTWSGRVPDGVILPVAPTLAVRPQEFLYYGYSAIVNVLDYTSGVFPVTVGDSSIDQIRTDLEPLSDMDGRVRKTCEFADVLLARVANGHVVRSDDIEGMPVGLQVMCPRLHEETVLALLDAINDAIK